MPTLNYLKHKKITRCNFGNPMRQERRLTFKSKFERSASARALFQNFGVKLRETFLSFSLFEGHFYS